MEQISQKEEKRENSMKYVVINDYSGAFCPITKGCKTCCCIPWSEEPRIKISCKDQIMVTRWQKYVFKNYIKNC